MIVVIDDERTFKRTDVWASTPILYIRNSKDALAYLAETHVNQQFRYSPAIQELWLDHDLGGDDNIRIVVDFLCLVYIDIERINIHSQNPTTDWIVGVLSNAGYKSVNRQPLPALQPS